MFIEAAPLEHQDLLDILLLHHLSMLARLRWFTLLRISARCRPAGQGHHEDET